ncbi:uncharacterized protein LOC141915399 [Tubulanus polymorphus]|uniref:uncharacterized protein LOC141915399 n=1 Tax=Tubulanus polymorphus TaxID=672921 RepID=UPI003DA32EBC
MLVRILILCAAITPALGILDYKNWCGQYNTGLYPKNANGCCTCADPIETCRSCRKPADALDEACLQHDRCVHCDRTEIPSYHFCYCERLFVKHAKNACYDVSKWSTRGYCHLYKTAAIFFFKYRPCLCKTKKCKTKNILKHIFGKTHKYCGVKYYRKCPPE